MPHTEIIFFFFIISLIYASVGFGGGSSYLAILALYELPFKEMRLIALICNIIVVSGGTLVFIHDKQVVWKKILPLIILSVPMAYLGARLKISATFFFTTLGCSLVVAAMLLWMKPETDAKANNEKESYIKEGAIGGGIGFLSGMVGIGGGIFLSPLLNLMQWDSPKRIAATASFFILVNSLSGIAGQLSHIPSINGTRILFLCSAVLAGGQIGSRIGIVKFKPQMIRRITAVLVFIAGIEILIKHL